MRVTILYLAAGNSRRFGENKLLYPLDGKAVYRHLLDRLAQIAGRHENWELLVVTQYERILEELVADQPYLKEETAERFLESMEMQKAPLGCVFCGGESGNPAWFSKPYFSELKELSGDRGGKKVLKRHWESVFPFRVDAAWELKDLDRKEDL